MNNNPRPIIATDLDWVLALNRLHEIELSSLTDAGLSALVAGAIYSRVLDDQAAYLIAFDQDADYDSPNFLWFRDRLRRFIYVDRIAVSDRHRGRGLARCLYEDLFAFGAGSGHEVIVCEVNSDPPNPASDAFHQALGFTEIGDAHLEDRGKTVRYLRRALTDAARSRP
jgi:predicted GNAT superfamily acetyltransferase